MAKNNKSRPAGPIARAFFKGLAIVLPAVITIAIFAWVWDILRVNVVELLIRGMDDITVFEARPLTDMERAHLRLHNPAKYEAYLLWSRDEYGEEGLDAALRADLRQLLADKPGAVHEPGVVVLIRDLPEASAGASPPMRNRSLLRFILDANGWNREYDTTSGRPVRFHWFEYLLATIVGLALVVLLGFGTRNFVGKRLVAFLEWFVTRTPVVRSVYPHAKQLVDFFFSEKKPLEFDTVCAIEYPRERVWAIAFVTGAGIQSLQDHTGQRFVTVYIPSSPAPMTGYTMFVPVEEVIRLDISVEDAMKIVISGGVLTPGHEAVSPASGAHFALSHKINEQVRERQTKVLHKPESSEPAPEKAADPPAQP